MNIHFYHQIVMRVTACELILKQVCEGVCVCVCVCEGVYLYIYWYIYIYISSFSTVFVQQEVLTKPSYYVTLCLVFKN
jgi:hypothetical protein